MLRDIYLGLGSNIGDRMGALKKALTLLEEKDAVTVIECSDVYETKPVGVTDQADFLNIALRGTTSSSPKELLNITQSIEKEMGRTKNIRWGPRNIDLDILLYNDENIMMEELIIPHPRMEERAFVLIPLLDVILNPRSAEVKQWLNRLPAEEKEKVLLYKQTGGWLT